MANLLLLVRSQILMLSPFFNSLLLYFVFVEEPNGEWWTTLLKCAPILCLILYMFLKGFELNQNYRYSQHILLGLICSCVGDALLNNDLFPHGMAAFALAQIFYILAFGWKPLNTSIGIMLYVAGAILVDMVYTKLDDVLVIGLPIYVALLMTMCWRCLARGQHKKDLLSVFCAVGSTLFVLSDGLIAIDMFLTDIPNSRIWIMSTYYVAQFSIALSTATECKIEKLRSSWVKRSAQNLINSAKAVKQRL